MNDGFLGLLVFTKNFQGETSVSVLFAILFDRNLISGAAGLCLFLMVPCADPEGGQGVNLHRKITKYRVS